MRRVVIHVGRPGGAVFWYRHSPVNRIGCVQQAHRPVGHERQQVIGDVEVVVDEVALGDRDVGPQDLVEVIEEQPAIVQLQHARGRAHEARLRDEVFARRRPPAGRPHVCRRAWAAL